MAEQAKHVLKEEDEDDLDGPITFLSHKSLKKKKEPIMPKEEEEDDNAPLVFSKEKKKIPSNSSKVKKGESKKDECEKSLKKMEVQKKRPSTSAKFEYEDDEDEKPSKSSKRKKEEMKTVGKVKKVKASQKIHKSDTKVKKVYELPGQKHDQPEIRDPLRIFYETLYEKVPTSEMAAIWMMERGLLPLEEAQKAYLKKFGKTHNQKFGSPAKFATPVKKSSTITAKKTSSTISVKKEVKPASKMPSKSTKDYPSDSDEEIICHKLISKPHNQKLGSPEKSAPPVKKSSTISSKKPPSTTSVKKEVKPTPKRPEKSSEKKLCDSEDDDDDDFILPQKLNNKRKASS